MTQIDLMAVGKPSFFNPLLLAMEVVFLNPGPFWRLMQGLLSQCPWFEMLETISKLRLRGNQIILESLKKKSFPFPKPSETHSRFKSVCLDIRMLHAYYIHILMSFPNSQIIATQSSLALSDKGTCLIALLPTQIDRQSYILVFPKIKKNIARSSSYFYTFLDSIILFPSKLLILSASSSAFWLFKIMSV